MNSQLSKNMKKLKIAQNAVSSDISKLPNELLLHIFKQLELTDKLNCTRVTKQWNQLISKSPDFLNETRLNLAIPNQHFKKFDFSLTRNYREVGVTLFEFAGGHRQLKRLFSNFMNLAEHLDTLYLLNIPAECDVKVLQLLAKCQSVENIALSFVKTSPDSKQSHFPEPKSIKLTKLRDIRTHNHTDWIFKFIDCNELDLFRVIKAPGPHMVELINNLTRLDSLELQDICFMHILNFDLKCKWKNLKIEFCHGCQIHIDHSSILGPLEKLVKSAAADSHLVLTNCNSFPKTAAFFMRTFGSSVARLDVAVNGIDPEFMNNLRLELDDAALMVKIRHFGLDASGNDRGLIRVGGLDWLFGLLPNLEVLNISSNLIQALDPATVGDLLKNVKSLGILDTNMTEAKANKLLEILIILQLGPN